MRYAADVLIAVATLAPLLAGCGKTDKGEETSPAKVGSVSAGTATVDTMTLRKGPLTIDIISNGRVRAREYADVYFRNVDIISAVMVKNGQRVRKGEPLARLDLFKLNSDKARQEAAVKRARLDMQDVLIGQGCDISDMTTIPEEIISLARVRSGLDQAEATYAATLKDIDNATLTAPFAGVVANVKMKPHSMSTLSEPFCRIINDGAMSVEFPILESELPLIQQGEHVEVTPFHGGETHHGVITEINPMIDENGQVTVKANISGGRLIDGLNVRVRSMQELPGRLSVPKSAVTLRSGRQVVFTYSGGKALWNYVTTGIENVDSYEITEGLEPGATVIYGGNENLAHESPVKAR